MSGGLRGQIGVLLLALSLMAACEESARNEAQLLLDRLDKLDEEELKIRARRLDGIEAMPISSAEIAAARSACLTMHRALVEAETLTAEAQQKATTFEGGARPSETETAAIAELFARSEAAIAATQRSRGPCADALRKLRQEYAAKGAGR